MESVAQLVAGMYVALPVIVAIKFHHLHKSEIFRLQEENLAELLQNLARENTLVGGTFFCLKLCKPLTGEAKSGKKRAISLCGESIMTKVGHEYFFGNAQCVSPSSPLAVTESAVDAHRGQKNVLYTFQGIPDSVRSSYVVPRTYRPLAGEELDL